MPEQLLPTTVVGSYPQPDWLVDHNVLQGADRAARARQGDVARAPSLISNRRRTTRP